MYEPMIEASGAVGIFGHGYTYAGHPVCAAVALRTLELTEERDLFAHAAAMAKIFQQRLRALGDTLAVCPPLVITSDQVHELFDKLETALNATLDGLADHARVSARIAVP